MRNNSTNAKESLALRFLYHTVPGRAILRPLTSRGITSLAGRFMSCALSRHMIPSFIRKNGIDMSQYEERDFSSFNDFFTRKLKDGARSIDPIESRLIAPCDGFLTVYQIGPDAVFSIKHSLYTASSLMGGREEADAFTGGYCLVFRLTPQHYHRYHFFDSGTVRGRWAVPGRFHTVRPIALEHTDVFAQNAREVTLIDTDHFGRAAYIEVGALLVGRIANRPVTGRVARGEEKGMFLFGGSTVVLLLEKRKAVIDDGLLRNSLQDTETPVLMGQTIGRRSSEQTQDHAEP